MSGSVRIYLRGHFQCSPDAFQAQMCDVDVSSDVLLSRINEGYTVIGAVAQTSNASELAATDSQQLKVSTMRILEEIQDRACKVGLPIGLSKFTDYIRSLYPEYYSERMAKTV